MVAKLKAFWDSLPRHVQAVLAGFGSAVLVTVLKNSASGNHIFLCEDMKCVKEHVATFLSSGATGMLTAYLNLNKSAPTVPPEPPAPPAPSN